MAPCHIAVISPSNTVGHIASYVVPNTGGVTWVGVPVGIFMGDSFMGDSFMGSWLSVLRNQPSEPAKR